MDSFRKPSASNSQENRHDDVASRRRRRQEGSPPTIDAAKPRETSAGEPAPRCELLAGLFAGLAYWAMDYTLLYPAVFALLWLAGGPF